MTKSEIRAAMRKRRKAVTPDERMAASARICERLLAMKLVGPVAVYLASSDEIDLARFIDACGVALVAPRWNGEAYELAELGNDFVAGPHGILEPPKSQALASETEVCAWIVPGLAFTRNGERLGYGGGWYDRLMVKARPGARKIGVGYRFQIIESLPSKPHDIRLDEIVTD